MLMRLPASTHLHARAPVHEQPKLPLGVPRRGFDLLSWLAVLREENIIGQLPILPKGQMSTSHNKSTTVDIEEKLGDICVKYKV